LGWCHRDIRWANIVRLANGKWLVIDLEAAGKSGQFVNWTNDNLPINVSRNESPFVFATDLYMVGKLLTQTNFAFTLSSNVQHLSSQLINDKISSAKDVLVHPFLIEDLSHLASFSTATSVAASSVDMPS
jgi:hypothetical protein